MNKPTFIHNFNSDLFSSFVFILLTYKRVYKTNSYLIDIFIKKTYLIEEKYNKRS